MLATCIFMMYLKIVKTRLQFFYILHIPVDRAGTWISCQIFVCQNLPQIYQ